MASLKSIIDSHDLPVRVKVNYPSWPPFTIISYDSSTGSCKAQYDGQKGFATIGVDRFECINDYEVIED